MLVYADKQLDYTAVRGGFVSHPEMGLLLPTTVQHQSVKGWSSSGSAKPQWAWNFKTKTHEEEKEEPSD